MNEQSLLDKEYPTQLDRIESMLIELLGKKRAKSKPKQIDTWYMDHFDRFWSFYPKKKGKQDALKAFISETKGMDGMQVEDFTKMLIDDSSNRSANEDSWLSDGGRYIPMAATYIRGKRWEDDITKSASQLPKDNDELYKFAIGQGMREPHVGESWDSYRRYVQGRIES